MINQELTGVVTAIKECPVLVIGDIMLDRFVYGSVDRISPESPVPVLSIEREEMMLGGAGNALANLVGLEACGFILSVIGDDEDGALIHKIAKTLGIDTSGLLTCPSRPTIVKTRYLAGHQQLLRTDYEKKQPISDDMASALLIKAEALMKNVKAVIISDYGKGLLRKDIIAKFITLARNANISVIVDPKGQDFSIYAGATAVTPNKKELSDATKGMAVESNEDVIKAAQILIDECDIEAVIATRSADGMSIIQKKENSVHLQTEDIEVFDVSGAGDTVIATIAAGLAAGANLVEAATLSNIAGSIVVTKVGTSPIRAVELLDCLSDLKSRKAALLSMQEAVEQIKRWKARGLKVGFTNGCFDILHFGHVSYLNKAREKCDRLIVGLNNDVSVKILKGEDRPIYDEHARASVLGSLSSVDIVVPFGAEKLDDDNTAIDLLNALKPDIYFKGGDYCLSQIPEAPTVQAYGGEVSVMPDYEGYSTTVSLKKMKNETA